MRELRTEIEIEAPPERVWQVLTDFERYPEWNPQIRRIAGPREVGARLEFEGAMDGGRTMKFRPRLLVVEPPRELRWLGQLLMRGLFDGEHQFQIVPLGPGTVRFHQNERFRGLLVPLLIALIGKSTRRGFERMNQALKERAEATAAD
jgi:hypothetical protein